MTSAAIAFPQLPYNALCIRIILQYPRSSYGISVVCGDKCDRISGCNSIGPNRSGNIRIVTNQAGQGLFHIVRNGFPQEKRTPFRRVSERFEEAGEMGVGAREFVVYLLQRPGNVLERIDLILKQFLGFYGIIERIVELVGEEFVILQEFVIRLSGEQQRRQI